MTDASTVQGQSQDRAGTTLRSGGLAPTLTLDDIHKTSVFEDLSASVKGFFERVGLVQKEVAELQFAQCSDKGGREYQEDAIFIHELNDETTFAVLADGMGGHAAGDVAAQLVVDEVAQVLLGGLGQIDTADDLHSLCKSAVGHANAKVAEHIDANPNTAGMGSTLVIAIVHKQKLYWLSVGDSPLYLFRNGKVYQVNQDHSMGPAIDQMAKSGMLSLEEARNHPDRNYLTSAINDKAPELIDGGNPPLDLLPRDIIIIASDGLQSLSDGNIARELKRASNSHPLYIGAALLNSVLNLDDPHQDNVGIVTLKLKPTKPGETPKKEPVPKSELSDRPVNDTHIKNVIAK